MSNNSKHIAYANIKRIRKLRGMSQTELAHKVGYADKTMISHIENGKIDLSASKLADIAQALGVSPAYLMGWVENPDPDYPQTLEGQLEEAGTKIQIGEDALRSQADKAFKDAGIDLDSLKDVDPNTIFTSKRTSTSGKTYYFDDEAAEIAQELFVNEGQRILMSASRGLKPEAIKALAEIAKQMKMTNPEG